MHWRPGRCVIVLQQLQCYPSAEYVVWPISAAAAELQCANVSGTFITLHTGHSMNGWWLHGIESGAICAANFALSQKHCHEDWAAEWQSWAGSLMGLVAVTHTDLYKPNLGSGLPHLSRKQMEAYSMKPLSGDTQISRSVSLYCSEGRRIFCQQTVRKQIALQTLEDWSSVWPLLQPLPHG